ncbi:MAG: type I-B CRISPR-associated protein Cas7/Cst2/DevR [Thermotoga sp.]|nr:MAG: type I-B CRISPR-associated protein Cas7/Cst2/DevR [Thermotoga sp.]
MGKTVNGFLLIDAPWSALNNAGADVGERTDNVVKVKTVKKGRDLYPYVSGQAVRYWWRDTLAQRFGWRLSPIERVAKVAYTSADPIEYDDDDIFGYMRAAKEEIEENGKTKRVNVTVTRISPLKNSPLLSIHPSNPTNDFGVMARQKEGDPVPYEHQFYSTVFKGIFSLDIDSVGRFHEIEKTGYKNMSPKLIKRAKEMHLEYNEMERFWEMPADTRKKRIKDVILALPYLSGGAKLTEHLTDVSPKFLVLAVIEGGNHIFMNIADEKGINFSALSQVIEDYKDIILSDIYIGKREGFMDEMNKAMDEFASLKWDVNGRRIQVRRGSINNIVNEFARILDDLVV